MNLNGFSFAISRVSALPRPGPNRHAPPNLEGRPNESFLGVRSPRKSVTGPLGDGASYCSSIRTSTGGARLSRPCRLAGVEGLEPPTPGFGDRCSSQLSYTPRRAALYSGRNRPRHLFVSSFSGFKGAF